jgi:hypothetical protein
MPLEEVQVIVGAIWESDFIAAPTVTVTLQKCPGRSLLFF